MGLVRVELTTSRLSGVRSNHLSYRPRWNVTESRDRDENHHGRGTRGIHSSFYNTEREERLRERGTFLAHLSLAVSLARASCRSVRSRTPASGRAALRKEVIQPHLPVRLPCYDFTPLTRHTFGSAVLAVQQLTSGTPNSGGVTGGVYKARERIHRAMLMRDY